LIYPMSAIHPLSPPLRRSNRDAFFYCLEVKPI